MLDVVGRQLGVRIKGAVDPPHTLRKGLNFNSIVQKLSIHGDTGLSECDQHGTRLPVYAGCGLLNQFNGRGEIDLIALPAIDVAGEGGT